MKVHLMYAEHDFDSERELGPHDEILGQDLELSTLFETMAQGDQCILKAVQGAVFTGLASCAEILYRQEVLQDCLKNPDAVRELYNITKETVQKRKEQWWGFHSLFLSSTLSNSINLLQMLAGMLKRLRTVAAEHAAGFESPGFTALLNMLQEELGEEYLAAVQTHLNELKFKNGILISAELGEYNQSIHYVLRRQKMKQRRRSWLFAPSLTINSRDESGCTDLSKRSDRAINEITNALAQSADHVLSFFLRLQTELAFYVGCLNLYDRLTAKNAPISFPVPFDCHERRYSCAGLYDVSLALLLENKVVGNSVAADLKDLIIITGANQGGKSTFLRSVGQAQLMMQCGMFVPAQSFGANLCQSIFTHYKKEEDATLESGKLEEELKRMNDIAEALSPDAMVLFNESFSATNEREGSEIGRQIVHALLENHIKVFFVSHFYDFSSSLFAEKAGNVLFLRAERQADGHRTFRLVEGEPMPTSFGEDIYAKIFDA